MLIGLTGRPCVGKDTVGAMLVAAGWQAIAFADTLRTEVAAAWGVDMRVLTERVTKEQGTPMLAAGGAANANWLRWVAMQGISLIQPRSPRWVLQNWGSFRREHDPLHFVRHVDTWVRYQRQRNPAIRLVVTDVRLANEAAALRGLGGWVVRVHRPGAPALAPDTAGHESEQHTDIEADADLVNDGGLLDLPAEVQRVLQLLGSHQPEPAA